AITPFGADANATFPYAGEHEDPLRLRRELLCGRRIGKEFGQGLVRVSVELLRGCGGCDVAGQRARDQHETKASYPGRSTHGGAPRGGQSVSSWHRAGRGAVKRAAFGGKFGEV